MELTNEFRNEMKNNYDIYGTVLSKINYILNYILKDINVHIFEEEYMELLEECCMQYASFSEMRKKPNVIIPTLSRIVAITIIFHSSDYNWDDDVSILYTYIKKK